MSFIFPKSQKLKKSRDINELFISGKSVTFSILRANYKIITKNSDYSALAGFSVSRKIFKKAVTRNLLKRRMREAYRLNKHHITEKLKNMKLQLHIMFIYNSDKTEPYYKIETAVKEILDGIKLPVE